MAARQGLGAQISQASEDAKRAVLQRAAPLKSSWFSNINTTCTIKSAPPRTPEVLNLLATKSGYLVKRNEQHQWQSRWCCVVPHTFLYYFDADIGGEGISPPPPAPTVEQQELLNEAVRVGLQNDGAPRSSLNLATAFHHHNTSSTNTNHNEKDENKVLFNTLQPAGIIDLECYTSVHRFHCSENNGLVLELAGDESVNPDLRSFYFLSDSQESSEEWTQSLLSMRHSALVDEREAFREVCDGFALQLQELHTQLDSLQLKKEQASEECYRVRSQSEEQRRSCLRVLQEGMERTVSSNIESSQQSCRSELESIVQQNLSVLPACHLYTDYTLALEKHVSTVETENAQLLEKLRHTSDTDQHKVSQLKLELDSLKKQHASELAQKDQLISTLQQKLNTSQKQVKVAQHEVSTQRGDFKTQMATLTSHKKILKREVLELRQQLEKLGRELSQLRHYCKSAKFDLNQEREKGLLLNKYIEKMETQVRVQQNMMELMSASGNNSIMGGGASTRGGGNSFYNGESSSPHVVLVKNAGQIATTPQEDDSSKMENNNKRHQAAIQDLHHEEDDENKSHVSELTEDRTQRQFDAVYRVESSSPYNTKRLEPPSYIIGNSASNNREQETTLPETRKTEPRNKPNNMSSNKTLDTISSRSFTHQQKTPTRGAGSAAAAAVPPRTDSNRRRLSVAQAARQEADRKVTPVRIRVSHDSPLRGGRQMKKSSSAASVTSQGSFFSKLETRIVSAIDNSVLGVPDHLLEDAMESSDDDSDDYATTTDDEERLTEVSHDRHTDISRRTDLSHDRHTEVSHDRRTDISRQTDLSHDRHTDISRRTDISQDRRTEASSLYSEGKNSSSQENKISLSRRRRFAARHHKKQQVLKSSPSLEERQAMQRAKQVAFLKKEGLIQNEENLRGGAGAARSDAGASNVSDGGSIFSKRSFRGKNRNNSGGG